MQSSASLSDMEYESDNALATRLWRLGQYVRERVTQAKSSGAIVEVATTYVKAEVTQFQYGDLGNIQYSTSFHYANKPEWHWRQQHSFIQETINSSEQFKECLSLVAAEANVHPGQAEFWLSRFVQVLVSRSAKGLADEALIEALTTFVADLHNAPMYIDVSAWVDGLWLSGPQLAVSDIVLRRPEPRDLETERNLEFLVFSEHRWKLGTPPAVIEFQVRGTSGQDAQRAVASLMSCLRLYRLGSVRAAEYSLKPNSIYRFGGTFGASHVFGSPYKYELAVADEPQLTEFVHRMRAFVPDEYDTAETATSPVNIAFRRYTDAVLGRGDVQERITSGITCLEALFLKAKERAELSHRLSLRVASLLRLVGLDALSVQGRVHQAYDIRSTYIHGGALDTEKAQSAEELCRRVLDYARMAVVIFLQLREHMEKNEIINRLDDGCLEDRKLGKLKDALAGLVVPREPLQQP